MNWDRTWVSVWYGLIALLLIDELVSIYGHNFAHPTLTQVVSREVPWWITIPFLAWLLFHFISAYTLGNKI
jgi:hypothetical protein